ncbi:MAG: HSP20 family protein [Parcubacteria group bacterium Gr01-1014_66]|nr:MAG: HSP20 family protein [Parcubacteria group bacterium Gr01-1014_66]
MDIYQTDKDVVVELEVPAGIDPEKIEVSVEGDTCTARGMIEDTQEEKDKNYYRKEIRRGSFERSVMLPTHVKAEDATAVCEKGVLRVTIPKAVGERAQRIHVQVKK